MRELALVFLRLGATSFGGPLAHIALMRAEFVDKRAWLSDAEFLDVNSAVNLIPGPNSTELAMHIGYKRGGFAGLLVAGMSFIAPAMIFVLALAALYGKFGTLPSAQAMLWGIAPVVVAIVFQALLKFAPSALKNRLSMAVLVVVLMASSAGISEIALVFAAAVFGFAAGFPASRAHPKTRFFIPPVVVFPSLAQAGTLSIFWVFLKMGCVVYGSGYVLLAYLRAELVENRGWISEQQLLDAIAIGQVTPGPVFTTATFLGWQIGGFWGALAATLGIFGPSFAFVALLSTLLERFINSTRARIFLDCVNAASFALMALVTFQLARAALVPHGKLEVLPCILGVAAAIFLFKTRLNSAWILGAGALFGLFFGAR